ncbi:MAG: alpha-ketoglutarate-dependent dioxygenase AlkB, partial [Leptolyngbya sp. SIO1D8]|nr:alpha-ketoglutarate-dependent dioxygenase AlkB [Leptolyngbya sp. SIO1D8]
LLCSRYARGRRECYYGLGVTLHKSPNIYPAEPIDRIQSLGDRYLPGWHSALLCEYRPGIGINPHRDHTCFAPWAVMINFGQADFVVYPSREKVITPLSDGAIVRLNTKVLHAVRPVQRLRYSLTFRQLKPEYQPTEEYQQVLPIHFGGGQAEEDRGM